LTTAAFALSFLLLVPALAAASGDFAVGGGTFGDKSEPTGVQHVGFAAHGGPTTLNLLTGGIGGDPVTGHFRAGGAFDQLGATAFQQEGPVTCLVVQGNQARLVYPNKNATPEGNREMEVLVFIEDNGPPVNGQSNDRFGFALIPDETPDDDPPSEQDSECVPPTGVPPTIVTLRKGNFTVHDAP
jgi:hypothetical protein